MNPNLGEQQKELPFNFLVTLTYQGRTQRLYKGKSTKLAVRSYWNAYYILQFLGLSARLDSEIRVRKEPFGGYVTELELGRDVSLHVPYGKCAEWPGVKAWSLDLMKQHLLASIGDDPTLLDNSD